MGFLGLSGPVPDILLLHADEVMNVKQRRKGIRLEGGIQQEGDDGRRVKMNKTHYLHVWKWQGEDKYALIKSVYELTLSLKQHGCPSN